MALVTISKWTEGVPEITRTAGGRISIFFNGSAVAISLSEEEAVQLVERVADFLGGVQAVEAAE